MEKQQNTFNKDVKFGRQGEITVKNYLEQHDYIVEDITEKFLSYDFYVYTKNNLMTICALEVKHQRGIADGKICVELEGKYGAPGWFMTSGADKYAFTNDNVIIFIKATELMRAFCRLKPQQIHTKEGKVIAFMNIADLEALCKLVTVSVGE